MEKINLRKSSELTAQNRHRIVMIYKGVDDEREAVGNAFVNRDNKIVPKQIRFKNVLDFEEHIEYICMY